MNRNKIIDYLANNAENLIAITEDIIYPYKGFDPRSLYKYPSAYERSIVLLEKKKYIKRITTDKFVLTLEGKLEIAKKQTTAGKRLSFDFRKWDHKWRILSFDIPEDRRRVRAQLRRYLHLLGFRSIQQSIWITPRPIEYESIKPLLENQTREKLLFVVSDTISDEPLVKKMFL
jgi:DNA-binding transcriptional regulator PaaX